MDIIYYYEEICERDLIMIFDIFTDKSNIFSVSNISNSIPLCPSEVLPICVKEGKKEL